MRVIFCNTPEQANANKGVVDETTSLRIPTGRGYNTLTRKIALPHLCEQCSDPHTQPILKSVFEPFVGKDRYYIIAFKCRSCGHYEKWSDRQID